MTRARHLRAFRAVCRVALEEPRVFVADSRPWERGEVAHRFKALRTKAHLLQKELARHIHADRKTINRIENLRTMPGPRTWKRFEELEARHNQPLIELPTHWFEESLTEIDCQR